jgi:Dolichyl-phosphate-mannose-protein mannosyltransferase
VGEQPGAAGDESVASGEPAAPTTSVAPADGRASRTWWLALLAICVVALGVRVGYTYGWQHVDSFGGDAYYYHRGANLLADGKGFVHPYAYDKGVSIPAADHPPGYIIALALPSLVGLDTILAHQLYSCVLGTITVLLIGIAGRRIAGGRAGLIAAGVAALYPAIWLNDAALMSETLALLCGVIVIIAAYRAWDRPSPLRFALAGGAIGLATLARAEAIMLVALLAVPLALWAPGLSGVAHRLGRFALAGGATLLVIAPWVGANLVRFDEPTTLSTQMGPTLEAANCDETYYGPGVGSWSVRCVTDWGDRDRSVLDRRSRDKALDYVADHEDRLPAVLVARIQRTFGLGRVEAQINFDYFAEARPINASRAGVASFYLVAVGAIAGAVILRRRGVPSFPLTSAVVNVAVTALLFYGSTRFRAPAEPALVLLAAVAADALIARLRRPAVDVAPEATAEPEPAPAREPASESAPDPAPA